MKCYRANFGLTNQDMSVLTLESWKVCPKDNFEGFSKFEAISCSHRSFWELLSGLSDVIETGSEK